MVIDKAALLEARKLLWYGLATVRRIETHKDPTTKVVTSSFVTFLEDVPCKLSYKTITNNEQVTTGPGIIKQSIKVSFPNDIIIPAGCEITITQSGDTGTYKQSGEPAVFVVHQEIPLIPIEDYA